MQQTSMTPRPSCAELAKLEAVKHDMQVVMDFLEWLQSSHKETVPPGCDPCTVMAIYNVDSGYEVVARPEQIAHAYCGIDSEKLEQERRALLNWQREMLNMVGAGQT